MRYVGRHRAPRPLYLRRPVVGGVAVAVLLGAPAYAATRPDAPSTRTEARDGTPAQTSAAPTAGNVIVIPTDTVPALPSRPGAVPTGVPLLPNTGGNTVVGGETSDDDFTSTRTRTRTRTTTRPPTRTTTKPPTRTRTNPPPPPEPTKSPLPPTPTPTPTAAPTEEEPILPPVP